MSKIPSIDGRAAISIFEKFGFSVARIRGSHHVMKKDGHRDLLSVPVHGHDPLKRGLLKGLISDAGLTVDEFLEKCS